MLLEESMMSDSSPTHVLVEESGWGFRALCALLLPFSPREGKQIIGPKHIQTRVRFTLDTRTLSLPHEKRSESSVLGHFPSSSIFRLKARKETANTLLRAGLGGVAPHNYTYTVKWSDLRTGWVKICFPPPKRIESMNALFWFQRRFALPFAAFLEGFTRKAKDRVTCTSYSECCAAVRGGALSLQQRWTGLLSAGGQILNPTCQEARDVTQGPQS